jgi:RNA polymerase sigma-70 factor (ECF subfamily)
MNRPDRRTADAALIEAVLAGNVELFGELVQAYQGRLYNAVARMVGNPDDAEDIVQDAFVQAFRKLDSFRASSSFYTWIYRIAVNAAINFHRRHRRTLAFTVDHEEGSSVEGSSREAPSQRLESLEESARVQQGLMQLSEEHRQILVMREIDDLSYEQIAEILRLPVGTVRSRLHRARLQLKDCLLQSEEANSQR